MRGTAPKPEMSEGLGAKTLKWLRFYSQRSATEAYKHEEYLKNSIDNTLQELRTKVKYHDIQKNANKHTRHRMNRKLLQNGQSTISTRKTVSSKEKTEIAPR